MTALALVAGVTLTAAACGGDDDDDATDATDAPAALATQPPAPTEAPAAPAPTEAPEATDAPAGSVSAFCEAEIAIEQALSTEGDPSEAIARAGAAAPMDVKTAFDTVLAEFEASGGESDAFNEAYAEMMSWMKDNCGYNTLEVTTTEYAFAGIPDEVPAGPTIITMTNLGEEFHEVLLMRKNDGVTESFEEILALGEEESQSKVTMAGAAFGPPGAESHGATTLEPGDYLAICFLPEGATPELMAQMEGPESSLPEGAGPPHFTHGMLFEFTVAG
jgi:hypothetical protein